MIDLDIQNFRNLRRVNLVDKNPISMIMGFNEAGKSSLVAAIQWCETGVAFGHKGKDVDKLVTLGEDRMHVRITLDNGLRFYRTRTGGDALKTVAERHGVSTDVLPLLYHQELCNDGGNRHMKAFLAGQASSRFDPAVTFQSDQDVLYYVNLARRAGNVETKQMLAYMERCRADQKVPSQPMAPNITRPFADDMRKLQAFIDECDQKLAEIRGDLAQCDEASRAVAQLQNFRKAKEAYDLALSGAKDDSLGDRRAALTAVTHINATTLDSMVEVLQKAGFENASKVVQGAIVELNSARRTAESTLKANPPPKPLPEPPVLNDLAQKYEELFGQMGQSLADIAANLHTEANGKRADQTKITIERDDARGQLERAKEAKGAWDAYDESVPRYEETKAKIEAEWNRWDNAIKAIKQAEREFVDRSGDKFAELVSKLSGYILQNRRVTIDQEEGIRLGNELVEDLSLSTRWRVEVAVMAAIAITCNSPLLVIDGVDVLDAQNKGSFLQFLLENVASHFQHIILTSTCKSKLEDEKPFPSGVPITKWILDRGEIHQLQG